MRDFFTTLTIVLVIVGFWVPIAWVGAIITLILAIGCAPSGKRPDGKAKSGGLLGWLFDDLEIALTMRDCPYCKTKVMKNAVKCPHCTEWIDEDARKKHEDSASK